MCGVSINTNRGRYKDIYFHCFISYVQTKTCAFGRSVKKRNGDNQKENSQPRHESQKNLRVHSYLTPEQEIELCSRIFKLEDVYILATCRVLKEYRLQVYFNTLRCILEREKIYGKKCFQGSLTLQHVRESFQKFCTLYVVSLKMNLFHKTHLQAINVISIVLYHSGPTFG
jgi:hypothetical protein